MKRWKKTILISGVLLATLVVASAALAAATTDELVEICQALYGDVFGVPNSEPLGACQWDMALINASEDGSYLYATGEGVKVGVIDSGVDFNHADIAPNLDVDLSCSFIFDDTPTADPAEVANGDCSNKAAVQDLNGHGTHVATTIAAPINGIEIGRASCRARV